MILMIAIIVNEVEDYDDKKDQWGILLFAFILLLSILNRLVFLFNNEIKKITLYSDIVIWVLDFSQYFIFEYYNPYFFIFFRRVLYLFPIGYGIYTKFLKE